MKFSVNGFLSSRAVNSELQGLLTLKVDRDLDLVVDVVNSLLWKLSSASDLREEKRERLGKVGSPLVDRISGSEVGCSVECPAGVIGGSAFFVTSDAKSTWPI